ncbi:MAG: PQQ-dependent sugar dehydrogenase [Alphaproteobacteria bacterium]|nr:PQQ-dependent sugar dehydrogenase [Alphaproteobacteria bacterium]
MHRPVIVALVLLLIAGAAWPARAVQTDAPRPASSTGGRAEEFASRLVHPWGLAFLPSGDLLVTERPGRVRYISREGDVSSPVEGAPKVAAVGQGGMLDIALSPEFERNRQVFISFAEPRSPGENGTTVARYRLEGTGDAARLMDETIVFRMMPSHSGGYHFGSRLAFAPDGRLFVTLGERNAQEPAQDLGSHFGKVVRINPDGSVPGDNPFVGRAGVKADIWSYGHRNPQAAAVHPDTGKLWIVEHGAKGGDEINIPAAGKNYGWPVISYGTHYSGRRFPSGSSKPGMEQPIYYWDPSIAPSGMAFYTGDKHSAWRGNLFVGALKFRQIHRLVLDGETIIAEEILLDALDQRIRAIAQSPDGGLYFLTDSPRGKVMRLVPGR